MELVLAANFLLDPIVGFLTVALHWLTTLTHNFGTSLVLLALIVKLVFWPLNTVQFRSIARMQSLQPQIKALQAKYKGNPQKLQAEQMALYRETGVNPFASCLPLLLQLPILWSLYYAINANRSIFGTTSWLWIGSPLSHAAGKVLATSLQQPDYLLLALYVVSMYFSVRFSSPAMDEQQAQQQKIMALVSPITIAFIGRFWPSALILYWLTFNVLTMAQQMWLMRRYRAPVAAGAAAQPALTAATPARDGATGRTDAGETPQVASGSARRGRRRRGSRR